MTTEVLIEPSGIPRGRAMIERAEWAARSFSTYDIGTVRVICEAVAKALAARSQEFAEMAVKETGYGVVAHKKIKNDACSIGLWKRYENHDYVTPTIDIDAKLASIPRPAGVIFALTPSTNPVATVSFKILLALMTRNAIVISPHPMAKIVCVEAAQCMAAAAEAAGAPSGVIQVVEAPSVPLITALMQDPRTDVIVATGGTPVVRASYSSGNPAIGVGPGNVPVLVDATADLPLAAKRIIESKSFDNSILCTNESVLIVEESIADAFRRALKQNNGFLVSGQDLDKLRETVFPNGHFDVSNIGKDATWIAERSGIRVPSSTKVLVAEFALVVPEEPLAHEKLCPVLGFVTVPTAARGIETARSVLRITGAGHSAAIHSNDPQIIMAYSSRVPVLRVSVNVGNSLGAAGIETNLAPTMTIGTGFFGHSSVGENLEPKHLINFTRIAVNSDKREAMPQMEGINPWKTPSGQIPPYPAPSNAADSTTIRPVPKQRSGPREIEEDGSVREEIRRIIVEELQSLMKE